MSENKMLVILSGGMDSTTLLYSMLDANWICSAITFNYGQKHFKEIQAAKKLCNRLEIPFTYVDLSNLKYQIRSALTSEFIKVPEGHYEDSSMKQTVVPNRNAIMITIASAIAQSHNIDNIALGVHAGDHPIYPDCRKEFINSIQTTMRLSLDNKKFTIHTPFIDLKKVDILRIGLALNVAYSQTWSCYKGGQFACGVCGTCVERLEAFKLLDLEDPLQYQNQNKKQHRNI
jgi:7-cyano-7-deazaguanine synthase